MRISLNLATRPYADVRPALKRLRIAIAVLAVVAIGLGFGLRAFHQKAVEARAREHLLDDKIAFILHERQQYQDMMLQPANAQLLKQADSLNKLFDLKTFSWTLAMEDLETVLPGGVQVTSLEPLRDKEGKITLKLRVVGPRNRAVEVVQNLEHSRHFLLPSIAGESTESTGSPAERLEPVSAENRVTFEIQAVYNTAAPSDRKQEKKQEASHAKSAAKGPKLPAAKPGAHPAPQRPGALTGPQFPSGQPAAAPLAPGQRFPRPAYMDNPRPAKPNPGGPR